MKVNSLLKIQTESRDSFYTSSKGIDNRLLDLSIENYDNAAVEEIENMETVEELQENIEEQKQLLESGQDIEMSDVVEAEASLEAFTSSLAGASRKEMFKNYSIENYGSGSNYRAMLEQNLRYKQELYDMAAEALSKHGDNFKEFFGNLLKTAKSEGDSYRKKLLEVRDSLKDISNVQLTQDVALTPMTVEVLTSDLLYQAALNFRLYSEGKFSEAKPFRGYCKWASDFSVAHGDERDSGSYIPMAIADKGSMITTVGHGKNINTIIADFQEASRTGKNFNSEDLYILATAPEEEKFRKMPIIVAKGEDESRLMASKHGIKTTQDILKAIDKLIALNDKCLPVIEKGIGVLGIGKWTPGLRSSVPGLINTKTGSGLINVTIWARGLIKNNINKMILRIPRILYKCGEELKEIAEKNRG